MKNRFPKLGLVLDWIWLLVWAEGAKAGWLEAAVDAGADAGGVVALLGAGRLGAPRLARRAGLACRPSTVTAGISISDGVPDDGGDAAVLDGCERGDGAEAAGAVVVAGGWLGAACSAGEAAGASGEASWAWAKPLRPIMTIDVVPRTAERVTRTYIFNPRCAVGETGMSS